MLNKNRIENSIKKTTVKKWPKNKTETIKKLDLNNLQVKAALKILTQENGQDELSCSLPPNTVLLAGEEIKNNVSTLTQKSCEE